MIIRKLCDYYEILLNQEKSGIPKTGFSSVGISYEAVIDKEGNLTDIVDLKEGKNKKTMLVPEQKGRSGKNFIPYFLCDKAEYCFGFPNPERFEDFKDLCLKVLESNDCYASQCFKKYLEKWDADLAKQHPCMQSKIEELEKGQGGLFVFRVSSENEYIHDLPEIRKSWLNYCSEYSDSGSTGQCLITGEKTLIAKTHTYIKGVVGANAAGGSLVGCNDDSFESYGKKQANNSPVGKTSMFKYTAALNWLLSHKKYKVQIGEATTVFWAEMREEDYADCAQELFAPSFEEPKKEEGMIENVEARQLVHDVLKKVRRGAKLENNGTICYDAGFYILGLTANNARLSVTFWHQSTFGDFVTNASQHHLDTEVIDGRRSSISSLLKETLAKKAKSPKLTSNLTGACMTAFFTGGQYPYNLFAQIIQRIKVDSEVNFRRAGIIKAYLLRKNRINNHNKEEITVSLNKESNSVPYRLGRLFAVLEKAQQDASGGGLNATIKDRYFGSAMSSPASIFPTLVKLSSHHVKKGEHGRYYEGLKGDILDGVDIVRMPKQMNLEEQGEFIMGYYHQAKDFYKKNDQKQSIQGGNENE